MLIPFCRFCLLVHVLTARVSHSVQRAVDASGSSATEPNRMLQRCMIAQLGDSLLSSKSERAAPVSEWRIAPEPLRSRCGAIRLWRAHSGS